MKNDKPKLKYVIPFFLVLAVLVAIMNAVGIKNRANKMTEGCDGCCASCSSACDKKEG